MIFVDVPQNPWIGSADVKGSKCKADIRNSLTKGFAKKQQYCERVQHLVYRPKIHLQLL